MRVVHVVNSLETGGAQTLIEALCQSMRPGDEAHVVVLLGPDTLSGRIESVASSVTYLRMRKNPLSAASGALRVRRIVGRLRPDVIHSHLLQADLLAALGKGDTPLVSTVHTSGGHESGLSSMIVTHAMRLVAHRYTALIACSPSALFFARSRLKREPDRTILNGTLLPRPHVPVFPAADRYLLSLARWHPMKDHENLMAALSLMGDDKPRLVCAGAGMTLDNPEVAALGRKYPDVEVDFRGPVEDVAPLIRHASALVLSSSHGEALPMAGIESLGHGVPIVTTDVGDCSLLAIDDEQLVAARDSHALAAALRTLISKDDEAQRELRTRARARAEELFDVETTAQKYSAIYQKVIR